MSHAVLLFLHVGAAIVWVGGMFFAYFCLRPAAVQVLNPPQRLPLWTATFRPFLRYAAMAVLVLILTGLGMLLPVGVAAAPHGWLTMMALGLVMAAVFVYVYAALYPRLVRATAASAWPEAASALNAIRRMVALNLALAVAVVAAAASAR
jgi:uncharacterized membrane protein